MSSARDQRAQSLTRTQLVRMHEQVVVADVRESTLKSPPHVSNRNYRSTRTPTLVSAYMKRPKLATSLLAHEISDVAATRSVDVFEPLASTTSLYLCVVKKIVVCCITESSYQPIHAFTANAVAGNSWATLCTMCLRSCVYCGLPLTRLLAKSGKRMNGGNSLPPLPSV